MLPPKLSILAALLSLFVANLNTALTGQHVLIVTLCNGRSSMLLSQVQYTVMWSSEPNPHLDHPSLCVNTIRRDHATLPPLRCHVGIS